jgi:hypothetical protein
MLILLNKLIIYTLCNGQTLNFYFLTFICLILNLQRCKAWLDFQRVRISSQQSIKSLYMVSSMPQSLSQKNVTIARILVCKFFLDIKSMDRTMFLHKSYLPLRRNYLSQKVLYGVLCRMIATAAWFQDLSGQYHIKSKFLFASILTIIKIKLHLAL